MKWKGIVCCCLMTLLLNAFPLLAQQSQVPQHLPPPPQAPPPRKFPKPSPSGWINSNIKSWQRSRPRTTRGCW